MEKEKLDINKKVAGAGKKAAKILHKTKDTLTQVLDQNDDGK